MSNFSSIKNMTEFMPVIIAINNATGTLIFTGIFYLLLVLIFVFASRTASPIKSSFVVAVAGFVFSLLLSYAGLLPTLHFKLMIGALIVTTIINFIFQG